MSSQGLELEAVWEQGRGWRLCRVQSRSCVPGAARALPLEVQAGQAGVTQEMSLVVGVVQNPLFGFHKGEMLPGGAR